MGDADAAALADELGRLQARQATLLERARGTSVIDPQALAKAEATFARVAEYEEKLRRVRSRMDDLAARTASMRGLVEGMLSPPPPPPSGPS